MEQAQAVNNGSWQEINAPQKVGKRPKRIAPPLPSGPGAGGMTDVTYSCKVDSSATQWESVPLWSAFSLSSDGSYPQIKVSKSKFCDLRTGKSFPAGSGRCYRIIF